MRLRSLHPSMMDTKGLVALWRESLLAKNVLENKTKGYKNRPKLTLHFCEGWIFENFGYATEYFFATIIFLQFQLFCFLLCPHRMNYQKQVWFVPNLLR